MSLESSKFSDMKIVSSSEISVLSSAILKAPLFSIFGIGVS